MSSGSGEKGDPFMGWPETLCVTSVPKDGRGASGICSRPGLGQIPHPPLLKARWLLLHREGRQCGWCHPAHGDRGSPLHLALWWPHSVTGQVCGPQGSVPKTGYFNSDGSKLFLRQGTELRNGHEGVLSWRSQPRALKTQVA